jgi:hypothetical protein
MGRLDIVPGVRATVCQWSDVLDGRRHIIRQSKPPINYVSADTARPCVHFENNQCDNFIALRINCPALRGIILDRLSDLWQTNHSLD